MASVCLLPTDPRYPTPLLALRSHSDRALPALYLRGELPSMPGVAIVGTRAASDEATRFARDLAHDLGQAGYSIWSGGARGVDAAAHEGALLAGAPTVVVTGSGHDHPYPGEHVELFERVLAGGGALLARVPDATPPLPALFIQRNAVLAALTLATIVVEAGIESGARSTAAAARRLGRHLLVIPRAPWDPRGVGCAIELAAGARAVTSAADVLAVVGTPLPEPVRRPRKRHEGGAARQEDGTMELPLPSLRRALAPPQLNADEQAVLDALTCGPAHADEICEKAGLSSMRAGAALLTLTLQAVVVEGPAGLFRRVVR